MKRIRPINFDQQIRQMKERMREGIVPLSTPLLHIYHIEREKNCGFYYKEPSDANKFKYFSGFKELMNFARGKRS